jgi:sugar phosphate isomerase/epimerase
MTQLDAVVKAKELGFDAIEFTDLMKDTLEEQLEYAKEIRAKADEVGIDICAYALGANLYQGSDEKNAAEVERLKGQLNVAKVLGAPVVRHDVCYREKDENGKVTSFGKMLPTIAKNARAVTEYAATRGIKTCTENHGFIAQDADRVEALYNAVDHENYGLLIDIGNFACADECSVKAVSRLAPYAIHVHAKDFHIYPFGESAPEGIKSFTSRGLKTLAGCAIGDGDIPTKQCIAILKKAGYDSYLTVEYEGSEDCIEGIKKGLAALKSYV